MGSLKSLDQDTLLKSMVLFDPCTSSTVSGRCLETDIPAHPVLKPSLLLAPQLGMCGLQGAFVEENPRKRSCSAKDRGFLENVHLIQVLSSIFF